MSREQLLSGPTAPGSGRKERRKDRKKERMKKKAVEKEEVSE